MVTNLVTNSTFGKYAFGKMPRYTIDIMWNKWCRHQDLNSGPTDYKSVALPAELYRHWNYQGGGILCAESRQCNVFDANFILRLSHLRHPPPVWSQNRLPVSLQHCFRAGPQRFQPPLHQHPVGVLKLLQFRRSVPMLCHRQ